MAVTGLMLVRFGCANARAGHDHLLDGRFLLLRLSRQRAGECGRRAAEQRAADCAPDKRFVDIEKPSCEKQKGTFLEQSVRLRTSLSPEECPHLFVRFSARRRC